MRFIPTELQGVVIVRPQLLRDERGFLAETWHSHKFSKGGINSTFVQDNQSRSALGVLRGMHIQVVHSQGKLVRSVRGTIFDVAVDLRKDSPHFGRWTGHILSDDDICEMWIPAGFAHGFYVLSEIADVIYKCTDFYSPENERTLRWDDEDVAIEWPLVNGVAPVLSAKDAHGLTLRELKQVLA